MAHLLPGKPCISMYLCIKNQNKINKTIMAHGHDILHMMEGNNYQNKEELVNAIIE